MKPGDSLLDRAIFLACAATVLCALLSCLPALFVPIGFLAEGDALDYRVPIMKWMLRHGSYPNWSWTFVDDYPMLGELLMLPFFAVKQELARVVAILAYFGAAAFGAAIGSELLPERLRDEKKRFFLFALTSLLGLQPLLVQADHVMVDNVATCFALGSFWLLLRGRILPSGLMMAGALATRYMIWGAAPGALLALLVLRRGERKPAFRDAVLFTLAASLGALPFLLRNAAVNGNPFFPLLNGLIQGAPVGAFDGWGRGKGLLELLLFPFDLLYTNSFERALFDTKVAPAGTYVYKLSFLFYAQLAIFLLLCALRKRELFSSLRALAGKREIRAAAVFGACHFFFWWFGSQQLRFFGCGLVLLNLLLLYYLFSRAPKGALLFLSLLPLLAIASVRQESWGIAFGKQYSLRGSGYVLSAERCFERAGVTAGSSLVGFPNRDVINGFFDYDFVFLSPNNLFIELPGFARPPVPDFIYSGIDFNDRNGFERWPRDNPCLLKRR
jgi:hypothetical protein